MQKLPNKSPRDKVRETKRLAQLLSLTVASMLFAGASYAQTTSLVVRGGTAPEPASTYRVIQRPAVSDGLGGASVAFDAKIRSTISGGLRGIFSSDPIAADSTLALEGDLAPPTFFRSLRRFKHPTINSAGIAAFEGTGSGSDRGIYTSDGIAVTVVGDTPPAALQGSLSRFSRPIITENAGVLLHATISGPGLAFTPAGIVAIDTILMRCVGGDLDCTTIPSGGGLGTGTAELLVAKNDPVPDRPGRFVCTLFEDAARASDWGIAFRAETKLDCADDTEDEITGIFRLQYGGAIETVALEGEAADPFPAIGGTTYGSFANGGFENAPSIQGSGVVAFLAQTQGLVKETVIYQCDPGLCPASIRAEAVLRPGTSVAPGISLSQFVEVSISDAADIVFRCRVDDIPTSTRGKGIYIYRDATGTTDRIAVKNFPVPGAAGDEYRRIYLPAISPLGTIAFRAKAKSPGGQNTIHLYLVE